MGYIPPSSDQLPFTFTEGGYDAPTGELLFRFGIGQGLGNLSAAIQVMQLYHDETYTYVKSCPKYVIGYRNGAVQIMKGRCIFGGIRDLSNSITVIDILSQTSDLAAIIKAVHLDTYDLPASILTHLPEDIRYSIRPVHEAVTGFPISIYGWQELDLYSTILMHPPKDLDASVFVKNTDYGDLDASIYAWHVKDLQASLNRIYTNDLSGSLITIQPIDLSAYLKVRYAADLSGYLRGWGEKDLSAEINSIFANDLNATIYGRDDMFKNLYFRIKGVAIEVQSLLGATIRGVVGKDLNAILTPVYISNLSGYLFPVLPKDIGASIYGWDVSDLQVILNGQRGPWDLSASIFPNENLKNLSASIKSMFSTETSTNLPINIHSWDTRDLSSSIDLIPAANLRATLIPRMYAKDLHASIYPKMIRLSTLVKVATMEHKDLSAMINSFCVFSDYKNLSASVYVTYKSDLPAYIKALKYSYKPVLLGATIGYADTITEVDKYQINVNILPSEMRTFDRYAISFDVFGAAKSLSAYINGIMRNVSLGATITAQTMDPYNFGRIKTTEEVVHLTYAGIFETSETVETSFKSLVEDYYYSSDGDHAWKMDRLDRWILEIKSFLPADTFLRLKRRLHKETQLYDLKRFSSIDEAMRHAIAYVTEYPQVDLGSSIYGRGRYVSLGATINPRYVKEGGASLGGLLTPVEHTIIVGTEQGEIIKM